MKTDIEVLVVEDSPVARMRLCRLIGATPGLAVADALGDGRQAVDWVLRRRPDIVLMDINLPRMDGLAATREIMERCPVPVVVMSSITRAESHGATFQAIGAGALAFVAKPADPAAGEDHSFAARHLVETLRRMAGVKVVTRRRSGSRPAPPPRIAPGTFRPLVAAVGASTGGPPALRELLGSLGRGFPLPLLVAQHISPGFEVPLANWLGQEGTLPVRVARAGESPEPGVCLVAPGGSHMTVAADGRIRIETPRSPDGPTPSVDRLFASLRELYGGRVVAALLTGMGRDGADELLRLRQAGALTLAQDEESSAIFGMPGEAVRAGAAVHVLPPASIAQAMLLALRTSSGQNG